MTTAARLRVFCSAGLLLFLALSPMRVEAKDCPPTAAIPAGIAQASRRSTITRTVRAKEAPAKGDEQAAAAISRLQCVRDSLDPGNLSD